MSLFRLGLLPLASAWIVLVNPAFIIGASNTFRATMETWNMSQLFLATFSSMFLQCRTRIWFGVEIITHLKGLHLLTSSYDSVIKLPTWHSLTEEKKHLFVLSPYFIYLVLDWFLRPSSFLSIKAWCWVQKSLIATLLASFCGSKWSTTCQDSRNFLSLASSNLA